MIERELIKENVRDLTDCGRGRIYFVAICDNRVWHHAYKEETVLKYIEESHREDVELGVGTKINNTWFFNKDI